MIENIIASLQGTSASTSQTLSISAESSLRDNARLGDIIQARVLRNYDGGRYAVSIGGKEQVVDSAIPLTTGELLYGRVIGVNSNKIILQKIHDQNQVNLPNTNAASFDALTGDEKLIDNVFSNYLATISVSDKSVLVEAIKNSSSPTQTIISGLILHKIGLPIRKEYLKELDRQIQHNSLREAIRVDSTALKTENTQGDRAHVTDNTASLLASFIADASVMDKRREEFRADVNVTNSITSSKTNQDAVNIGNSETGTQQDLGHTEPSVGRWILNAQSHDNVAHRLLTLPILIDGKLIEVDMSFYSQKQSDELLPVQRSKRMVFSLNLENLGVVNAEIKITDRHLKIVFSTESELSADYLSQHISDLKSSISDDWNIDDIQYQTTVKSNDAFWSVVTHHISQESISRLM